MSEKNDQSLQFRSYLAPKYWPLWLAIGLLRLTVYLPNPVIHAMGTACGLLMYYLMPSRRRVARINLKQAYPDYSSQKIEALSKKAFKNLGISIFEMGIAWFETSETLKQRCQIEGKEHLDKAMANNKGVILLTGHFTSLEMGARLIGFYTKKYNGVFKQARNPLFNAIMVHYRSKFGDELFDNKNARGITRGLKNGHATWFAPDQDFRWQETVFSPFLGGIASTLTATAKLARITGAPLLPFYPVRLEKGKGFKLIVLPPLQDFPTGDIQADCARVNKTIEAMIHDNPEQYLWSHKRFKRQPDGRPSIYK